VKYSDGSIPQADISTITFQPAAMSPDTKAASGSIEADGSFQLHTIRHGDGAKPGDYRVTVHIMVGYPNGKLVVAKEFTDPESTPLKATVKESGENKFDFTIERP
jgi:hypothetical protein